MEITKGTRALVTGANGGLGQAIARALAGAGATLTVTGRRREALLPLAKELSADVVVADLASRDDVERLAELAAGFDVVVLNAALPGAGEVLDLVPNEIDRALEVNLRAPIRLARSAARGMVDRKRGSLVFISSISGKVASQGTAIYSATKFGLRGFALGLREDLRPHDVGVSTIFPGFIRDAGMFASTGVELPRGAGTRSPEDVAAAVVRAVRTNPAEIEVAAAEQRLGAFLAHHSHDLVARIQRTFGGAEVAAEISERQRGKR